MNYSFHEAADLIRACAEPENSSAWKEFVQRFHRLIAGVVLRTCARWGEFSSAVADELVQETYLKLCADNCRLLREFHAQHPDAIYGYLKVVAANLVNDHFRAMHAEKRGGGKPLEEITNVEPSTGGEQSHGMQPVEREILLDQIDACLQRCTQGASQERDLVIFKLYYRQGFSAKAIAGIPSIGLTIKGVESAILRITRLVRAEITRPGCASAPVAENSSAGKAFREGNASLLGEST